MVCRVPDQFLRQSINKEFQRVKFQLIPPNHYKFSIDLSGNLAGLVGCLAQDPPSYLEHCVCHKIINSWFLANVGLAEEKKQKKTKKMKMSPRFTSHLLMHACSCYNLDTLSLWNKHVQHRILYLADLSITYIFRQEQLLSKRMLKDLQPFCFILGVERFWNWQRFNCS